MRMSYIEIPRYINENGEICRMVTHCEFDLLMSRDGGETWREESFYPTHTVKKDPHNGDPTPAGTYNYYEGMAEQVPLLRSIYERSGKEVQFKYRKRYYHHILNSGKPKEESNNGNSADGKYSGGNYYGYSISESRWGV